jgi:uncharacterized membrane protein
MIKKKTGFFYALERAYNTNPGSDTKIVLGNFTAQVHKEAVNFPKASKYSLHTLMNNNGSWLIQFALTQNIITVSTFYPHTDIYKSAWMSHNGVTSNQIDHLLLDRSHKSKLLDGMSY